MQWSHVVSKSVDPWLQSLLEKWFPSHVWSMDHVLLLQSIGSTDLNLWIHNRFRWRKFHWMEHSGKLLCFKSSRKEMRRKGCVSKGSPTEKGREKGFDPESRFWSSTSGNHIQRESHNKDWVKFSCPYHAITISFPLSFSLLLLAMIAMWWPLITLYSIHIHIQDDEYPGIYCFPIRSWQGFLVYGNKSGFERTKRSSSPGSHSTQSPL